MKQTETKLWKFALVQHPMWLLIAEDTVCAERTPPWGCPSLDDYAERLDICLDSLEKYPQLHVNFDFSAVELEDLAGRYPDLIRRVKESTAKGRVSFVNGTYSQPHLQILSVESAIRQFEYGLRVIESLSGYRVTCYAAQEPGLTPQLPQILAAMGYATGVMPDFPYGVQLEDGQVQHWAGRWEWLAGDDILAWRAPDGTTIPIWLKTSGAPDELAQVNEIQHGFLGHTRLRVDMPDMMEVSAEWVRGLETTCEFVQLDQTVAEMAHSDPPQAIARIDANYAYVEGVDAEELSRANMRAESALLTLESAVAFFPDERESNFDFDAAWKTILKAQHHDAYWTGGPELRSKSIERLNDLTQSATETTAKVLRAFARRLPAPKGNDRPAVVFHPYARPHSAPITLETGSTDVCLVDEKGRGVAAQPHGSSGVAFVASAKGLGYQTVFLREGREKARPNEQTMRRPHKFSNDYYSAAVRPDGVVTLLAPSGGPNVIKGEDGNVWLCKENGEDVFPELVPGGARVIKGPVFDLVESVSKLGAVDVVRRLTFYHDLPWFNVETELDFTEPTELGDYFDDRTKLHYLWRVGANTEIRHAVGGCAAAARSGKSFVVYPWLDAEVRNGGLAFCLFNATKCWLDADSCLRFVAAWGHNGNHFNNRQGPLDAIMGYLTWMKPMDLRLLGKRTIRYAVWPHAGRVGDGEVADWAGSLLAPPTAFAVEPENGREPWSETFFSVGTPGVVPLSARSDGGGVAVRLMEMDGESRSPNIKPRASWCGSGLRNLDGTKTRRIGPHKIVEARLEKE